MTFSVDWALKPNDLSICYRQSRAVWVMYETELYKTIITVYARKQKTVPITVLHRHCRGPQQDPACHRTPRRSPNYSEETEDEEVRTCLPIIRSGKDHLARKALRGEQGGGDNVRQWTGLDFPGSLRGDQEEGEDRGSDGKTTSESGQDWTSQGQ